jgi:hypothetical protein
MAVQESGIHPSDGHVLAPGLLWQPQPVRLLNKTAPAPGFPEHFLKRSAPAPSLLKQQ